MVDAPEKIWIEQDDCPYFYEESELVEVGSPVTEYTRSDLVAELEAENEWLKHALEAEKKRADEAEAENERLRAALANSDQPCVYCTLPRDEWSKCASGFPGCARADDAMGCPELGAAMECEALRARVAELEACGCARDQGTTQYCAEAVALQKRVAELEAKLNSPELHDFSAGVVMEAAHQRERWGSEHDKAKGPDDWFWLIAYLATKARQAITYGDHDKARHHIITTAAALANWHASLTGSNTEMRPGVTEASGRAAIKKEPDNDAG